MGIRMGSGALALLLAAAPAWAQEKDAELQAAPSLVAPAHARHTEAEATVTRKGQKRTAAGVVAAAGRLTASVQNHPLWIDLGTRMRDPRMSYVSPDVRQVLEGRYQQLSGERSSLIPSASALDGRNDRLLADSDRLRGAGKALAEEVRDYEQQVADHNARCNPAPDEGSYRDCLGNASRLNAWKRGLNDRVAVHNGEVRGWEAAWKQLEADWSGFVTTVGGWGQRMKDLINDIIKALSKVGDCTAEQHRALQDAVDRACKRPRACKGNMECPELAANLAMNRECAAARKAINDTCFKGGDEGHKQAYQEALNAIQNCLALMEKKKCEEGGVGVGVPRKP